MSEYSLETRLGFIDRYSGPNKLMDDYYDAEIEIRKGVAIPPVLTMVKTVVGWPSIVIDVLEERLDFQGWDDQKKFGLAEIYEDNSFAYESSLANIDTLLYGVGFIAVHTGQKNEPKALITAESPKDTYGYYNRRTRRLDWAITRHRDEFTNEVNNAVLYEPMKTTYYTRENGLGIWKVSRVDPHNLGRVPIVMLVNRGRAGRRWGKSEITRSIRSITDTAVRTLLAMEVNREFYSAPQRYVLGAKENAFTDDNGLPIPGWKSIMGSLWNLERDEEWLADHPDDKSGGLPQVGQFPANPAGPYLDQLRGLSMMIAAEGAISPGNFGFVTDNPPSADSIRAQEGRLIKRAERRITAWDPGYIEVGQLAAMIASNGKKVPSRSDLQTIWRDPATPTKAADADRAVKLVGSNIIPADSSVTYDMVGLSPKQQKTLERDKNKATFRALLAQAPAGGGAPNGNEGNPNGNQPTKPVNNNQAVGKPTA